MAAATSPRKAERHPAVVPSRAADAGALSDPHNSFFVHTFGQKEHADGLLRAIVPPALGRRLRWETLSREPASFVDTRLRWLHSDLLFSVRTLEEDGGEGAPVYLPIEHQSRPHPLMAYRVLRYVTRAWDEHLRKHRLSPRLPLIVPAVVYNGREPWNAARSLRGLLEAPAPLVEAAAPHAPQCGYLFIDLRHEGADRLAGEALTAFGRVALWAMEVAGDDERLLAGLRRWSRPFAELRAQPDWPAALGALLRYILATHEHLDPERLRHAIAEAIDAHAGENVVTVYEQLIEQGRQKGLLQGLEKGLEKGRTEGLEEGRTEGRAAMLIELLAVKFGTVPVEAKKRIEKASSDDLTTWGRRVLPAATLEEVFTPAPAPRPERRARTPRR